MKKSIRILAMILVICLSLGVGALAADGYTRELIANYVGVKWVVDGVNITPKDANGNVVDPFIVDGTTYLPVRAVAAVRVACVPEQIVCSVTSVKVAVGSSFTAILTEPFTLQPVLT